MGSKKKIESFQVTIDSEDNLSFEDLLAKEIVQNEEYRIRGKEVSLMILENNRKYVVGLMVTSRDNNIPPKKPRRKKRFQRLGVDRGEGLAYGNVFLYEKKRRILLYEVNKFGCNPEHFILFLYKCFREDDEAKIKFRVKLEYVLKRDQYERMVNMSYHKSVEIAVANPTQILKQFQHDNGAFLDFLRSGRKTHSDKLSVVYSAKARNRGGTGLASKPIFEIIKQALGITKGENGKNVKKLIVSGYVQEGGAQKLRPIDLLADRFLKEIELDEPRENTDLLELQRQKKIKDLYSDCLHELDEIFEK